jgi:cytochrome c-type biogenesis protein CcsB
MNVLFFKTASCFYLVGALAYLGYILFLRGPLSKAGTACVTLGFASHTLALVTRYLEAGHTPVTNLYESLSFFAWMLIAILLIVHVKYHIKVLGAFLSPIALILMLFALALPKEIIPLAPVLQSLWHPVHVFFAFLGNAMFALGFCCAVMYLLQEHQLKSKKIGAIARRLPSLMVLDDLNYQSLKFGFPLLTLGIITGAIWAEYAWGRYWGWDPKETWSLITWFLYAALLHQRLTVGWRGRKAAIMAITGFAAVLFTFLGVNLLLPGLHSYANW